MKNEIVKSKPIELLAQEINDEYQAIEEDALVIINRILKIGSMLKEVKDQIVIPWTQWCGENLHMSKRQADNYVRLNTHGDQLLQDGNPVPGFLENPTLKGGLGIIKRNNKVEEPPKESVPDVDIDVVSQDEQKELKATEWEPIGGCGSHSVAPDEQSEPQLTDKTLERINEETGAGFKTIDELIARLNNNPVVKVVEAVKLTDTEEEAFINALPFGEPFSYKPVASVDNPFIWPAVSGPHEGGYILTPDDMNESRYNNDLDDDGKWKEIMKLRGKYMSATGGMTNSISASLMNCFLFELRIAVEDNPPPD